MKRIVFTKENRTRTRDRSKTQTRRIGNNPLKVKAGDVLALAEPTQVLTLQALSGIPVFVNVLYPDTGEILKAKISPVSQQKLHKRKDPYKEAIARFMLDDFARHYVRILDIRYENLQEINDKDAIAEGIPFYQYNNPPSPCDGIRAVNAFACLWDSINQKPGRTWNDNPRVTAYTYEFLDQIPPE